MSFRADIEATRAALYAMHQELCNQGGQNFSPSEAMREGLAALDRLARSNAALWGDVVDSGRYDVKATRRSGYAPMGRGEAIDRARQRFGPLAAADVAATWRIEVRETEGKTSMKRIIQDLQIDNRTTADGKPDGGTVTAPGLTIEWQRGPLVVDGVEQEPNGLFLETAVRACIARLEYYQTTEFKGRENAIALTHLETALLWLGKRAADREARGVLGTHEK